MIVLFYFYRRPVDRYFSPARDTHEAVNEEPP